MKQSTQQKSRVEEARKRFGKPFAHEQGTTWKRPVTPILTQWMQSRGKQ